MAYSHSFPPTAQDATTAVAHILRWYRHWRWYRWVALVAALGCIGAGGYLELDARRSLAEVVTPTGSNDSISGVQVMLACLFTSNATQASGLRWLGVALVGAVLARWKRQPAETLLLHLASGFTERPPTPAAKSAA